MKLVFVMFVGVAAALNAATPKEVCDSLAKAAQADNFKAFAEMSVGHQGKQEKSFHSMHKDRMAALKNLTCGNETVAGKHAIVETAGPTEKRLIPFLEMDGTWKFDVATYKTFYRHEKK
ncbi:MAG: hypothetical protein HYR96_06735 [Deltaproteobacteria bacterium]|nr:hypothetical protein [Deltaproteobacteria bacterium]MBI3296442.1 hypothetical protein [Deltaproteobacteria bacterium]